MTVVTTLRTAPVSGGVPSRPANSRCAAPISVAASVSMSASAVMRPSSRPLWWARAFYTSGARVCLNKSLIKPGR